MMKFLKKNTASDCGRQFHTAPRLFIAMATGALVLACTAERELASLGSQVFDARTKVLKLAEEYDRTSILIKFADEPEPRIIEELAGSGISDIRRLFPSTAGRESLEARFGLNRWYEADITQDVDIDEITLKCASLAEVSAVEYNHIATRSVQGSATASPLAAAGNKNSFDDPYLSYQWHYHNNGSAQFGKGAVAGADIGIKEVWDELGIYGDPGIIVAVIDEGVKYTHPDLAANMWVNEGEIPGNGIDDDENGYIDDVYGYNFCDKGPITWNKSGDSGHGTHCAGTIAAVNNNGIGVAGVAGGSGVGDGCRIMSCQIFSDDRGGTTSITARAIKYAADMGASVISCSFGYGIAFDSDNTYTSSVGSAEIDAVHYFEACKNNDVIDGGIAIFAAGNDTHPYAHYPGAFADIISVSAFAPDFLPAYYTNYGPGCNIAAPGGEMGLASTFASEVLSTLPSELEVSTIDGKMGTGYDYGYMQGTSMACPHVSGVVALALSYARKQGKTFTRDEFKNMILSSTNDIDQRISKQSSKSYQKVYISGTNRYYPAGKDLVLAPYYHQMGTGAIDAWQLMMNIDGTPSLLASIGAKQWLSLDSAFGTSSVSLTYLEVDVPESTVESLGLQRMEAPVQKNYPAVPASGYAYVQYGRLYIHPTKAGAGTVVIKAVGGGDKVGGGDNAPGGMEIEGVVSVVSRPFKSNNQSWL